MTETGREGIGLYGIGASLGWKGPVGKNIGVKPGKGETKAPKIGKYFRDCPPSNGPGSLSAPGSHLIESGDGSQGHSAIGPETGVAGTAGAFRMPG